jgi:hypothetical protein
MVGNSRVRYRVTSESISDILIDKGTITPFNEITPIFYYSYYS